MDYLNGMNSFYTSALALIVSIGGWLSVRSSVNRLTADAEDSREREQEEKQFGLPFETVERARLAVHLSVISYLDDENAAEAMKSIPNCQGSRVLVRSLACGARYVACSVVVGQKRRRRIHVVAVRGSNNMSDWILNGRLISLTGGGWGRTTQGVAVHSAWFDRARNIYEDYVSFLFASPEDQRRQQQQQRLLANEPDEDDEFIFTGHSMGGAVACLLSVLVHDDRRLACTVSVFTFGQPAWGTKEIRRLVPLSSAAHSLWRFVQEGDLVPSMMGLGYEHTGCVVACGVRRFYPFASESPVGRAIHDVGMIKKMELVSALGLKPHAVNGYKQAIETVAARLHRRRRQQGTLDRVHFLLPPPQLHKANL